MNNIPRLLNYKDGCTLQRQLFSDIQVDGLLSDYAVAVLQRPCDKEEILRRQELFRVLEDDTSRQQIYQCLDILKDHRRAVQSMREAIIPLEQLRFRQKALLSYITVCEQLGGLKECGELFKNVTEYFSSEHIIKLTHKIRLDCEKVEEQLSPFKGFYLSFSDKKWLTPDYGDPDAYDAISGLAKNLGFSVPEKNKTSSGMSQSMSEALMSLYADKVSQATEILKRYNTLAIEAPCDYISELEFFFEIKELINKAADYNITHCFAQVSDKPRCYAKEVYDISLLKKNCIYIVPNDADFTAAEPFYFLTGANGGGKTTYLRTVGINLVLFLAGCPIFAREAEIYPFEYIASHFPTDERFNGIGRLEEEVRRVEEILGIAKSKTTFLLFNETYSGTDDRRGYELLQQTVAKLKELNCFGVYVTHFHEVETLDYPLLSAQVDENVGNKRTFCIVKTKGSLSSYAADILKKYKLDRQSLKERRHGHDNQLASY